MQAYNTVEKRASDEFVEKRSRFIGYVCPVSTVDEANGFVAEIKQKHWDAKHNVYAYVLKDGNIKKFSDDGEPQGTAGHPVLEVIEKSGLCDVCVVVTRYFGGILLGAGGLVRAYTQGAAAALRAGNIITMKPASEMYAECDYNFYSRLQALVENNGGMIESADFTEKVSVNFIIDSSMEKSVCEAVFEASNGRLMPQKVKDSYLKTKFKEFKNF